VSIVAWVLLDPIDEFFDLSTWLAAVLGAMAILFAFRALRD
jgi:hypothetical protein